MRSRCGRSRRRARREVCNLSGGEGQKRERAGMMMKSRGQIPELINHTEGLEALARLIESGGGSGVRGWTREGIIN